MSTSVSRYDYWNSELFINEMVKFRAERDRRNPIDHARVPPWPRGTTAYRSKDDRRRLVNGVWEQD